MLHKSWAYRRIILIVTQIKNIFVADLFLISRICYINYWYSILIYCTLVSSPLPSPDESSVQCLTPISRSASIRKICFCAQRLLPLISARPRTAGRGLECRMLSAKDWRQGRWSFPSGSCRPRRDWSWAGQAHVPHTRPRRRTTSGRWLCMSCACPACLSCQRAIGLSGNQTSWIRPTAL